MQGSTGSVFHLQFVHRQQLGLTEAALSYAAAKFVN
jgi:hypothetical protein